MKGSTWHVSWFALPPVGHHYASSELLEGAWVGSCDVDGLATQLRIEDGANDLGGHLVDRRPREGVVAAPEHHGSGTADAHQGRAESMGNRQGEVARCRDPRHRQG